MQTVSRHAKPRRERFHLGCASERWDSLARYVGLPVGGRRTVSPFISERPTLFCRYGIMFLMIVAHGTDVSGSYGGHTEAVEATQRL